MTVKSTDILADVKTILRSSWTLDPGRTVPDLERVGLTGNHGIQIEGTVLYADMADSTKLVDSFKSEFAAEIYKSFLLAACKVISGESGDITAFDGDRVMAVFTGTMKNTNAVKAALKINYIVKQINGAIAAQYPSTSFTMGHAIGIDTSKLLVAKTGIRKYNDLVWVGPAANWAAKMANVNDPGYPTWITEAVYKMLHESAKVGGTNKTQMWEQRTWTPTGKTIYRSNFWWTF
jgi:class 3 adenylate cyclase